MAINNTNGENDKTKTGNELDNNMSELKINCAKTGASVSAAIVVYFFGGFIADFMTKNPPKDIPTTLAYIGADAGIIYGSLTSYAMSAIYGAKTLYYGVKALAADLGSTFGRSLAKELRNKQSLEYK